MNPYAHTPKGWQADTYAHTVIFTAMAKARFRGLRGRAYLMLGRLNDSARDLRYASLVGSDSNAATLLKEVQCCLTLSRW